MIKYVPIELAYEGVIYEGEKTQEVPKSLADIIDNHPQMFKMKPSKHPPVDKFRHFKSLSVNELQAILSEYEKPIKEVQHELEIHRAMGTGEFELKRRIATLKRLSAEFEEVKVAALPLIQSKLAEEARLAKSLQNWAEGFGAKLHFTESGYPAMTVGRQAVIINDGRKS